MTSHLCLLALAVLFGFSMAATDSKETNFAVNGSFEDGLKGWNAKGEVALDTASPLAGKVSLRLGPGPGSVTQRYKVPGLRILWLGATAKLTSSSAMAVLRVRCLDARGRVLMDLKQAVDSQKATTPKGDTVAIYLKTHAYTAQVEIGIEKLAGTGQVEIDDVALYDYDHDRVEHAPKCDLDAYMDPIWSAQTIRDESVLMLSTHGGAPTGHLLFRPTHILSVRDSTLQTEYREGVDFDVVGQNVVAKAGSAIPTMKDRDFPKVDFPWLSLIGKHLFVTYSHDDVWGGPPIPHRGAALPRTLAKLENKKPLNIVSLGDSITLGINVSGYRGDPPYMPTWVQLFEYRLRKLYNYGAIHVVNAGLGGMTARWGADNARDMVGSLKPDLVLVAFGMNDFWSVSPSDFRKSIAEIIARVRERQSNAEFVLISSIRFDPAYTSDPVYVGHMTDYAKELESLRGEGIESLDMTTLSEFLYARSSAKDLLADPMHPDDFLARVYAQALIATLSR